MKPKVAAAVTALMAGFLSLASAQELTLDERARRSTERWKARGLAEDYKGIHTQDGPIPDLFPIRSTGVSTEPVRRAAKGFLDSLDSGQRSKTIFPVDDEEWRVWMNRHLFFRQGVSLEELNEDQRAAAFSLLENSLSSKGLKLSFDIMNLNYTLGELTGNKFEEFNERLYWFTVMGEPSSHEPWGWQLDGHHLIINYFVLGDQVVMTPVFVGSEPVTATSGKYAGTAILQDEQDRGLAFLRSLNEMQHKQAVLKTSKDAVNNIAEAFTDNVVLDYAGVAASSFTDEQKAQFLDLIGLYVGNMDDGHARIKMGEVHNHIDETYFAWIGGTGDDSVFYYRIHSPVILIEFDHQKPANLDHLYPPVPTRQHVHSVVRTPNGNDYGKDLLRQHYEEHPHQ
jgi:hypothetical protein